MAQKYVAIDGDENIEFYSTLEDAEQGIRNAVDGGESEDEDDAQFNIYQLVSIASVRVTREIVMNAPRPEAVEKPEHDTPWSLSGPNHDVCIVGASGEAVYRTRFSVERSSLEGKRMAYIVECVNAAEVQAEWVADTHLGLPWAVDSPRRGVIWIVSVTGRDITTEAAEGSALAAAYREIVLRMNGMAPDTKGGGG